ncbi:MAG: ABC transporter substrate-binding protein [Sphingomonadaceae bacterium]
MMKPVTLSLALALMTVPVAPVWAQEPAAAATPVQAEAAGKFVDRLANRAFGILRDDSLSRDDARTQFRALLRENFNLDEAGLRLIRRHRASLTPQQLSAYRAALPDFLVNTYSDRLYDYADSQVRVIRTAPRGTRGDVDVFSSVSDPKGGKPIDAIWTVKANGPKPLIQNLTVNGVNISLTQEADFNAYIEKNGFDALVNFMRQAK